MPDIEFMFRGAPPAAALWFPGWKKPYADGYGIRPCLLHPDSRGEVLLRSSDPRDKVKIVHQLLHRAERSADLARGLQDRARGRGSAAARAHSAASRLSPGPKVKTDAEIDNWIRNVAATANHPASTCVMGTGPHAVVDPQFRVHGAERLRVVDASAMPDLVSGAYQRLRADDGGEGLRHDPRQARAGTRRMSTKQVGDFTVTAVSDGVLYSNHDVILGVDKDDSARLTGVPYGQPLPLDVNCFLIRHGGKLILSDAGTGHTLQPPTNLGKLPENLRAIGVDAFGNRRHHADAPAFRSFDRAGR